MTRSLTYRVSVFTKLVLGGNPTQIKTGNSNYYLLEKKTDLWEKLHRGFQGYDKRKIELMKSSHLPSLVIRHFSRSDPRTQKVPN